MYGCITVSCHRHFLPGTSAETTAIPLSSHCSTELSTVQLSSVLSLLNVFPVRLPNFSLNLLFLIYKAILRPVWTYGIELWGCASSSNIEILQRYQSKLLRLITQAPWYVANHILHRDLDVAKVRDIFQARTATHHTALTGHPNPLMRPLLAPPPPRRLKWTWTFDALN